MNSQSEYELNINNDEAKNDEITIFINCKITDENCKILSIVGVGFRVDSLKKLLKEYEDEFDVQVYLLDSDGVVQVSTEQTGYEKCNLFENCEYPQFKKKLRTDASDAVSLWYSQNQVNGYVVSHYIENLNWHLVVENNTVALNNQISSQLYKGILVFCVVLLIVLFTITTVIRKYNAQIIELTTTKERRYYEIRQEAAKELYENIYELDITNNCIVGESTKRYFENLGVPANTPYDEALKIIVDNQIKKEYQQGYLEMFLPHQILAAYEKGIKSLTYDFMVTTEGTDYYWMRIMACIYIWSEDNSVHMTVYRQNINDQKEAEKRLFEQMQSDSLSGLYNKAATTERISELIKSPKPKSLYAFLILDIDHFKNVNDTLGHAAGDFVISQFAQSLKKQFEDNDIVGRIGGDEFAVFLPIFNMDWLEKRALSLVKSLNKQITTEFGICNISTSIGISVYPDMGMDFETLYKNADAALYQAKENGRNRYAIYGNI